MRRETDWLTAGAAGSAAMLAARGGLCWAAAGGILIFILYMYLRRAIRGPGSLTAVLPRWLLWLELPALCLAAAGAADACGLLWKGSAAARLFPPALLALAAAAAAQGTAAARRSARIAGTIGGLLAALLLLAALPEAQLPEPAGDPAESLGLAGALAVPLCGLFLPVQGKRGPYGLLLPLCALLLCLTAGRDGALPLRAAMETAAMFSRYRRFEALLDCVLTAGIFLELTLFFCAAGEILEAAAGKPGLGWVVSLPAAGLVWWNPAVPAAVPAAACVLCWGLIPVITLPIVSHRRDRKRIENT